MRELLRLALGTQQFKCMHQLSSRTCTSSQRCKARSAMFSSTRCLRTTGFAAATSSRGRVCRRAGPEDVRESVKSAMDDAGIEEPSRAPPSPARPPQTAEESGLPKSVTDTLIPRVAQLKRKQLSEGTTDFTSTMPRLIVCNWARESRNRKFLMTPAPACTPGCIAPAGANSTLLATISCSLTCARMSDRDFLAACFSALPVHALAFDCPCSS
jgi:hypothetical protein